MKQSLKISVLLYTNLFNEFNSIMKKSPVYNFHIRLPQLRSVAITNQIKHSSIVDQTRQY